MEQNEKFSFFSFSKTKKSFAVWILYLHKECDLLRYIMLSSSKFDLVWGGAHKLQALGRPTRNSIFKLHQLDLHQKITFFYVGKVFKQQNSILFLKKVKKSNFQFCSISHTIPAPIKTADTNRKLHFEASDYHIKKTWNWLLAWNVRVVAINRDQLLLAPIR